MLVRLNCYCQPRTLPVALLFSSYNSMSTLRSSTNLPSQASGSEGTAVASTPPRRGLLDLNPILKHLGRTRNRVHRDTISGDKKYSSATETLEQAKMSITCSKISSVNGKESASPCESSSAILVTEVTEHQCSGTSPSDQQSEDSEPSLQQNDELWHNNVCTAMLEEHSLPTSFGKQKSSQSRKPKSFEQSLKSVAGSKNRDSMSTYHKRLTPLEPFDICQLESEGSETNNSETDDVIFLRSPRGVDQVPQELEVGLIEEEPYKILRPGMVLLKNYISPSQQVSIVRKCREFGLGRGGFYQPGYKGGAKLRLHMMCLGLDWDPQTRKYQKQRRIDRAKPPDIPSEFHLLVADAMQDSLSLIKEESRACNAEDILPQMTPNICIVNFYTETGKLGLHQDRDESRESLSKGLPVVSFSIGDAAEFLYGDQRDANKAEKLVLESGDVLIFGGESRHVFHGISSIIPDSAPKFLLEQTKLRPGRLNLTFRQY